MPSIHKAQNTGSKMITQISENLNVHRQYPFISVEWLYVHARTHTHTYTGTIKLNVKWEY